ncbi:GGDEF domain-containing protein [Ideonella sp. DXS29W]|uniref:diguanylate cyclase n=1 Tax=Ideonella lacteola TaxID=2984193 RepID=A0ABU9C1M3_9BURK
MSDDDIDAQTQRLIQRGEIDRAVSLARERSNHTTGAARGWALLALASACNSAGHFSEALRSALTADALFTECDDAAGAHEALLRAATALRAAGDHAAAIELLERVEQHARAQGDEHKLAQALRMIGINSSILGRHQHAVSCLTEAKALCRRVGSMADQINARLSLLNAHNREVEGLPATDLLRRSVCRGLVPAWQALADDCEGPDHRRMRAMALGNRAITLHALGRDEEAAAELRGLLPEYRALGMRPNEGLCLSELGHCLVALGRHAQARDEYLAALVVLNEGGTVEDRMAALEGLALAEEALGHPAAALAALKQLRALERQCSADAAQRAVMRRELRIELARLTSQWAREASEDPLTGLGNRRALQAWLAEHLPRVDRGETLSLVLLDLDHFKQINDRFGHGVGDEVLVKVARLLGVGCRAQDRAVRYGGEEFVLALAGTSRDGATDVAERVRQAVADHAWAKVSPELRVTASLGVADASEAAEAQALLTLADKRLYAAKIAGRNRVVTAG